jgi:hypothetical protein
MTTAGAKKKSAADKAAEEAAEQRAAINEADADFREAVAKATEKRDKAIEKATKGKSGNVAEIAWNETKSDDDPLYKDCAVDHRRKLDDIVTAVRQTGNADVVGLEDFEAKVVELLKDRGEEPGTLATAPTGEERAADIDSASEKTAKTAKK